jgi:hypothetical protein
LLSTSSLHTSISFCLAAQKMAFSFDYTRDSPLLEM